MYLFDEKMKQNKNNKIRNVLVLVIISLIIIISSTFIFLRLQHTQEKYMISSSSAYNNSLCASTSYSYEPNGFNTGIRLKLIDKITERELNGSGNLETIYGGGGIGTKDYSCMEGILKGTTRTEKDRWKLFNNLSSDESLITAYSEGYSPTVIRFRFEKNKLSTIEIPMIMSCSGGSSYFDNLQISGKNNKESRSAISDLIERIGLNYSDYIFSCIEAKMERGGYIKAKGKYKDGKDVELSYRWGWCSSGGTDCGWNICFKTDSASQMSKIKNTFCQKITSRIYHDDNLCLGEEKDNTDLVREQCAKGEFEKGNTISIVQESNRCISTAIVGDFDCINS